MFDFYINPATGDIDFDGGTVTLVSEPKKRVRQELETTLRTFVGEWFNNLQFGGINKDYIGRVGISKIEVDAFYRRVIMSNPEVLEILDFTSSLNTSTRHYELDFTVRTPAGDVNLIVSSASNEQTYQLPDVTTYLPPTTPSLKSMATFIYGTSSIAAIFSKDSNPIVAQTITGTSSISASPLKLWNAVALTGSSTMTAGEMVKVLATTISGTSTVTSAAGTLMSANITGNVSSLDAVIVKRLASNIGATSSLLGAFMKSISTDITGTSNISALMARSGVTSVSGNSSITSTMTKLMSANISATSFMLASYSVQMSSDITGSSVLTSNAVKTLKSTLTGISSISANSNKKLTSIQNNASSVSATITKRLAANIPATVSTIFAKPNHSLNGNITGSSGVVATMKKIKKSSSIINNTSSIVANMVKTKNISSGITGSSSLTANLSKLFLAAGDTLTAYDTAVVNDSATNYWKLHEDYGTSVPSPATVVDMLLGDVGSVYSPSISSFNFTGEALLNYPSSRSINLNSSSNLADLKYRLMPSGTLSQSMTLNFWVKIASSGVVANPLLAAKTTTGNQYWSVILQNTGALIFSLTDYNLTTYTVWTTSSGVISTNNKYFVSIIFDNSQTTANKIRVYINGALVGVSQGFSNSAGITLSNSSALSDLLLVPNGSQGHRIESISLHKDVLTPTQITDLYTLGNN